MVRNCRECEDAMLDYRWLNDRERAAVDAHIATCANCREAKDLTARLGCVFEDAQPTTVPVDFADNVMEQVHATPPGAGDAWVVSALAAALAVQVALIAALERGAGRVWATAVRAAREVTRQWLIGVWESATSLGRAAGTDLSGLIPPAATWNWPLLSAEMVVVFAFALALLHAAGGKRTSPAGPTVARQ